MEGHSWFLRRRFGMRGLASYGINQFDAVREQIVG